MLPAAYISAAGLYTAFFATVSVVSFFSLSAFGWKNGHVKYMIQSSSVSLFHGFFVFCMSTYQVLTNPYELDAPNSPAIEGILAYSTGYFIVDFLYLLFFMPDQVLYMAHHGMCLAYMSSAIAVGRGGLSVMLLMSMGECTNPFHNLWHILVEVLKEKDPPAWAQRAYGFVTPALNGTYPIMRLLVSPVGIFHLVWFFMLSGAAADTVPLAVRILWSLIALGVLFGSVAEGQQRLSDFLAWMKGGGAAGKKKAKKT